MPIGSSYREAQQNLEESQEFLIRQVDGSDVYIALRKPLALVNAFFLLPRKLLVLDQIYVT